MTIGQPDWQRAVVTPQVQLSSTETNPNTWEVSPPKNTRSLWIIPGQSNVGTATVTGKTSGLAYPVVALPHALNDSGAATPIWIVAVMTALDDTYVINFAANPPVTLNILADQAELMSVDAATMAANQLTLDNVFYYTSQELGAGMTGLASVPNSGFRIRVLFAAISSIEATPATVFIEGTSGGEFLTCATPGNAQCNYGFPGLPLEPGEGVNASSSDGNTGVHWATLHFLTETL